MLWLLFINCFFIAFIDGLTLFATYFILRAIVYIVFVSFATSLFMLLKAHGQDRSSFEPRLGCILAKHAILSKIQLFIHILENTLEHLKDFLIKGGDSLTNFQWHLLLVFKFHEIRKGHAWFLPFVPDDILHQIDISGTQMMHQVSSLKSLSAFYFFLKLLSETLKKFLIKEVKNFIFYNRNRALYPFLEFCFEDSAEFFRIWVIQ